MLQVAATCTHGLSFAQRCVISYAQTREHSTSTRWHPALIDHSCQAMSMWGSVEMEAREWNNGVSVPGSRFRALVWKKKTFLTLAKYMTQKFNRPRQAFYFLQSKSVFFNIWKERSSLTTMSHKHGNQTTSLCNEISFYPDAFLFSRGIDFCKLYGNLVNLCPVKKHNINGHKRKLEVYTSEYYGRHSTYYS